MKDYIKVIVTVVITFLATSFLYSLSDKSNATQSDLIVVKTESKDYTDKAISQHEKVQTKELETFKTEMVSIKENIADIKDMTGKLLDMQLKEK